MQIIDGKQVAQRFRGELKKRIDILAGKGIVPGLSVILVGNDPASASYVKGKEKACLELGMHSDNLHLPQDLSQEKLISIIEEKNADPRIHGILVQLPLPSHINEEAVIMAIDYRKDVDGFHPVNIGRMVIGKETFLPCTPHGILVLLKSAGIPVAGSHVVVVGRSNIVGKPVANMLVQKNGLGNATVTVCHTGTKDLAHHTRQADIIIAAAGKAGMITADMVAEGAVVIDVGVNRVDDPTKKRGYRLVGDVDFDQVAPKTSFITPVPGGVGPMTITMLMSNTVESAERSIKE
ncbi:MAG: bifunctional methylenetetrahydrofolate dehydrogenase/methenyltetrahydrofolate cyclohydrolase FolD [Spirochaetales bacterium]|nr:bifunctional methylenetetrahydrofolate dehydrogenase/methenyltetrahydrofolate cyclohydrolase FolD [Spirochaetales bacterium]